MKIRFVSKNENKIKEVQSILKDVGVDIVAVNRSIDEIQTEDVNHLVKDKLLKAFKIVGRPVFVEHTGLYIESLNGFPGGLTQIFWDKLQADKFTILFGNGTNCNLIAKTIIGYCDSRNIFFFEGDIAGKITSEPRGNRDFQWDCIFMPDGENETFAEMCERKNELSMRKIAFDKFKDFLIKSKK
jgi:XTP/dITP diphosphohydrolase